MSFDRYIGIDWSGAEHERGGIAVAQQKRGDERPQLVCGQPWTRSRIVAWLIGELSPKKGKETKFIGLDFCFGYPAGAARKVFGAETWKDLTRAIQHLLKDKGTARAAAAAVNEKFDGDGPFRMSHADRRFGFYLREGILRYRLTELFAPGALSAWDVIAGPQVALSTLTGIAALADLIDARERKLADFKVFPFEDISPGDNVLAEIYPGLAPRYDYVNGDEGDALRITRWVHEVASAGHLLRLPPSMRGFGEELSAVIREEGWIAGLALADRRL